MGADAILILGAIKAVGEAVAEGFRYAQTPAGQATITKMLNDQAKWDAFWDRGWTNLLKFLRGELLK